jgi:hypothetical protein
MKNMLFTYVGPVRPADFTRTRHCPRPYVGPTTTGRPTVVGGPPVGDVDRVLQRVERNLTTLTCIVPMAEIKDLPLVMQPHVVGVPPLLHMEKFATKVPFRRKIQEKKFIFQFYYKSNLYSSLSR